MVELEEHGEKSVKTSVGVEYLPSALPKAVAHCRKRGYDYEQEGMWHALLFAALSEGALSPDDFYWEVYGDWT